MAQKNERCKHFCDSLDKTEAGYATLIEGMDKSPGDIMDYLKEKGVDKNTIIVFMSDNDSLSTPGSRRGAGPHTQNLPLRAGKGSVYEGAYASP